MAGQPSLNSAGAAATVPHNASTHLHTALSAASMHEIHKVRRTTGQPRLSAIVQARCLSLFGHIVRMPDETDARSIITASPLEN